MEYTVIDKYLDRITDESTPAAPVWKNARDGAPSVTFADGNMLAALYRLYKRTGDKKYLEFIDNYAGFYIGEDGAISGYEQDNLNLADIDAGRALFDIYRETGNIRYKKAIDLLYNQIMRQPKTNSGSFGHSKECPDKVYLCEAAPVFYIRYETEFNRGRNYEDIVKQYGNVYAHIYDNDKKLFYRGWDESSTEPDTELSNTVDVRAIGWFLAGLADTISYFDMSAPDLKAELITLFRRTVEGLERYVDGDKYMIRLNPENAEEEGNYFETSASLLVAYAMMKGARLGYTDRRFSAVGEKIFNAICREYVGEDEDGNFVLGGIRSEGENTEAVNNDENGVVPLVMAYTEIKSLRR